MAALNVLLTGIDWLDEAFASEELMAAASKAASKSSNPIIIGAKLSKSEMERRIAELDKFFSFAD